MKNPLETFFQHVFNFNSESKKEMLNIAQYTVVALIPIVILNKVMQKFVPEADDEKGSVELLAEVLIQVIIYVFRHIDYTQNHHFCSNI